MKKCFKFFLPAVLVILLAFAFTACGADEDINNVYYSVSFDADGGNFHTSSVKVKSGELVSDPGAPTKNGNSFVDWYLGDEPYDFSAPVTSNLTLTAKWEPMTYTVTFDTDGGTAVEPVKVAYGEKLTAPEVTKEFSTLDKWYNGGAIWDFEVNTVTSDITLSASWRREQATVVFNANYDTSNPTFSINVNKGDPVSERSLSRYGFVIEGWYTEGGEKWDFTAPVTSDITLYASWVTAEYEIIFDTLGGGKTVVSVAHGSYLTEPKTPTRAGYVFAGWYWDEECSRSNLKSFNEQVYRSYTLYAKWVENKATEGLEFLVDDSGKYVSVVGYSGSAKDVVIPEAYEGVPVKYVQSYAFNNKSIEFLYIPKSIARIGEYAFNNCALFSVSVADDSALEVIEQRAFSDCDDLRRFYFGENCSLREIGAGAFYYCRTLCGMTLPNAIESVATDAFESCGAISIFEWGGAYYIGTAENPYFFLYKNKNKEITELTIHEDARIIAKSAFSGCSKITSITIPEGVRAIGVLAFENCSSVTEIRYNATEAEDVEYFSGIGAFNRVGAKTGGTILYVGGSVKRIPANMFAYSGKITDVVFLNTQLGPDEFSTENLALESIGSNAFRSCSYLTSFELTNGLTEIGEGAFTGCARLVHIINKTHIASGIEIKAGTHDYGDIALNAMLVTEGGKSAILKTDDGFVFINYNGYYLISYEGTSDNLILPSFYDGDKPYVIKEYAFANMTSALQSVIIPQGIVEIPSRCFTGTEINSVTISNTVRLIGSYAFSGTHLEEIIFESGCTLEEIQEQAFNSVNLEKFVIPKSVKRLGQTVFSHSSGPNNQIILFENDSQIEFLYNNSFNTYNSEMFTVDSYGAMYIGSESNPYLVLLRFNSSAPKSYVVMEGTRVIAEENGSYTFGGIKEITLPASIAYVGYVSGFSYTPSITLNLADMALLNRLVKIISESEGRNRGILVGAKAINVGGDPLKNLVIEEGITEIYAELFKGVESIETISLPTTLVKIGGDAFAGCNNVKELTVPVGITYASFGSMSGLERVYINAKNAKIYISSASAEIVIGNSVEVIGGKIKGAASVSFADGAIISEIGSYVFSESSIQTVAFPTSVKKIGDHAFYKASSLTSVMLTDSITEIGEYAFGGTRVAEITVPGSIKTIPAGAFYECAWLERVVMSDGVEIIESNAFGMLADRSNAVEITLPSTLLRIEADAFSGYDSSCSVKITNYIPNSCYFVAKGAFGNRVTGLDTAFYYGSWYYIDESGDYVWIQNSPKNYTAEYDLYRKNAVIKFVDESGNAIGEKEISITIDGSETATVFTTDFEGVIRFTHDPKTETVIVIVDCPEGYELPTDSITLSGIENTVVLKAKA